MTPASLHVTANPPRTNCGDGRVTRDETNWPRFLKPGTYAGLDITPSLSRLRDVILDWATGAEVLDSGHLMDHLTQSGLAADVEQILAAVPVPLPAIVLSAAMPAEAEAGWWHIFGFLNADHLREEVNAARIDAEQNLNPETPRHLLALTAALNEGRAGEPDGVNLVAA
jgi:DNA primase